MLNFMPLAHGALGSLDEIAAIVVGLFASVFVVLGFLSRKREEQTDQPSTTQIEGQADPATSDHYRLD